MPYNPPPVYNPPPPQHYTSQYQYPQYPQYVPPPPETSNNHPYLNSGGEGPQAGSSGLRNTLEVGQSSGVVINRVRANPYV